MVKKTYKKKLLDPRWQKVRLEVLQRANYTCEYCGEQSKTLHIHHMYYIPNGNPWDVDQSALESLCEDCHYVQHVCEKLSSPLQEIIQQATASSIMSIEKMPIHILIRYINKLIIHHYPRVNYNH